MSTERESAGGRRLARRLDRRGVVIEPGRGFFGPDHGPSRHYRLAYSSIHEDRIPEGIRLIAEEIRASPA